MTPTTATGRPESRDDRRRVRPARLAAAHPEQGPARSADETVPRPERSATRRACPRHVAHRLRCAEPAHDVRGQTDARPWADAGHRARKPRVPRQAGRTRRRLPGTGPRTEAGAGDVHGERRHRTDRAGPGASGQSDAGEVRDLLRPVPRVRPDRVDRGFTGGTTRSAAGRAGAHPRTARRQGALPERRAGAVAGLRAAGATSRSDPYPRRSGVLSGGAGGAVQAHGFRGND